MTTRDERLQLAREAEVALTAYLSECANMLWPGERNQLRESRRFLAKEAEG